MKPHFRSIRIGILSLLCACQLQEEPTGMTADGILINKYTRQALAGISIEVRTWRYGAFGYLSVDSITSTRTGADGSYHIALDATAKGATYRVRFRDYRNLFDLTDYRNYDSRSFTDGASLVLGRANQVNFEATPYVPVRVLVDTNKRGATSLAVGFFSNESSDYGDGYWGTVLYDTTRTVQRIMETHVERVVPNRKYRFLLTRATAVHLVSGQTRFDNEVSEGFDHFVGYNDTTVVSLH